MPRPPTPRLISVQQEDAGFFSMTLCWDGRPARRIAIRLQDQPTSLADAKAAAADELLRYEPHVLAWMYEHARPGARCDEPAARAEAERGASA